MEGRVGAEWQHGHHGQHLEWEECMDADVWGGSGVEQVDLLH